MANEVKNLENNKISVKIEISPEKLEEGLQKAYLKTRGKYSYPGFRKGKVPRKVLENAYGELTFFEDAFDDLFNEAYIGYIESEKLDVVSRPENLDIAKISKDEGVEITCEAYVKPEVKVKNYKGVEIIKEEAKVSAKDVNEELKRVQEQNVRWVEVDREAKTGDTLVLDYSGSVDGNKFDGGTAEGQTLELGSNTFIPGFEDQLVGSKAGDKKDVVVTFPKEYHADNLAGKEAVFACNIISVKEKEVPEINDEFASDVSEFDTLAEYKKDIKKNLTEKAQKAAKDKMENELISKIVKSTEIDVPQCMIDNQVDYQIQQMQYQLMYSGMKLEDYLKFMGKTMDDLREEYKESALLTVKSRLVIEALIKQEKFEAPEKDIDVLVADAADQLGKSVEDYKKTMNDDDMEYFENRVKVDKLFDFLMENAKFVEKAEAEKKEPAKKSSAKPAGSKSEEKKAPAKKTTAKKAESKKETK